MGLTSWILNKLKGDPEEQAFRKEVNAKAKLKEKEAFHLAYEEERMNTAIERGKLRARQIANKGGQSGILNTLGNIGEKMGKASEGLVKGIEINPDGANTNPFNVRDPFEATYEERRHKRRGNSLETVDPFDTSEFK